MENSPYPFDRTAVLKPAPPVTRIGESAIGRPLVERSVPSIVPVVSCANRPPGRRAVISQRPSRTTARLRPLPQHCETADRISKCATQEDVRQKVGRQRKPRKADKRGHAIRSIRNPTMISIAAGDDSGNREGRDGVTRGETSISSQQ